MSIRTLTSGLALLSTVALGTLPAISVAEVEVEVDGDVTGVVDLHEDEARAFDLERLETDVERGDSVDVLSAPELEQHGRVDGPRLPMEGEGAG